MRTSSNILLQNRVDELSQILIDIECLNMNDEYTNAFIEMCLYRGWRKLTEVHKSQMINISSVNSGAVLFLATQGKMVGLHMLERLSVVDDEQVRIKAVVMIIENGVKASRNKIDLIVAAAKDSKGLFEGID
ncbi:hypothetical protein ACLHDG_08985 [Sulfurovum sp. CS9]|uniref:hypothetical protein n=1 Tax=Sulfurovum sp. CS9 TaxID=3391146 RepID=UPI0039EA32CB